MSNGMDDTNTISQGEKLQWIAPSAAPPWLQDMTDEEWGGLPESQRIDAVNRYMRENEIELEGQDPLGGYVAPLQQRPGQPFGERQGYQAGDEYNLFINRGSTWIASLQDRMINAGLLKEEQIYQFGRWTSVEANKMKTVLGLANETGVFWGEVLDRFKDRKADEGGDGAALPTKFLENEDELTSRLQASLPGLLGGNFLSESDARSIARAYRDYASGKADEVAPGKTVEKAMSFNTFVEKQEGIEEGAIANRFALLTGALARIDKV